MHNHIGANSLSEIGDGRQLFVVDFHQFGGILRDVPVLGDDEREWVTDET